MTTAAIVQARYGSSRLPGKVLKPLGALTPLAYVLRRCARIPGVDVVVCAVPDRPDSAPIEAAAKACGAIVVRGDEDDVLDRYRCAARAVGAATILRVTSDCPLLDPALAGEVLDALDTQHADYACNNMPALWPHGLDCEAFRADQLDIAAAAAVLPGDREHVTPFLRRNPALRRVNIDGPGGGLERQRWTLDYEEDYAFFVALWDAMGERAGDAPMAEIAAFLAEHPAIAALNRMRIDETRLRAAQAASSISCSPSASSQSVLVSEAKRKPGSTGLAPTES
jgi:spore coat polysaccharide biosynthesis protein SpsF (cytidylyltransferase family)